MLAARFLTSAADPGGFPADDGAEVAFVGRSNSGKSSAINALTGVKKLARVSKTPGRTRLVNFFELSPGRRLVDLPGYGFANVAPHVREGWRGLLEAYLRGRKSLRGLVITVDMRRGLTELDWTMIEWARALGLPIRLLLTKADKLRRGERTERRRSLEAAVPAGVELTVFSALTGEGIDEARSGIEQWLGPAAPASEAKKEPRGGSRGAIE